MLGTSRPVKRKAIHRLSFIPDFFYRDKLFIILYMRYFAKLAYNGTRFFGWQRQPDQISVQETIETAFSTILRTQIDIIGCGRTDTGVHARQYFIHFDFEGEFPKAFLRRINKFLSKDIVIYDIFEVKPEAHARFDAHHRAYEYHLIFEKNPFQTETAWLYPYPHAPSWELCQKAAQLLLNYEDFFPFCKSNTDVKTMKCELKRAEWVKISEKHWVFHIAANRFLRGMVRLIVGMTLNVGLEKIQLEKVKKALEEQKRLEKSWSVPPEGLFLTEIRYSL